MPSVTLQLRRRCKSAPKHRPDSSLKELLCEEQRCSELLPRTKNQCQDRSGMTGGTDHATMCPRPRLSQETNEFEEWDACNLACDPRKLNCTENCDKLSSSDLLWTSVHLSSQEPWHEFAGEYALGQALSYLSKGTMANCNCVKRKDN